MTWLKSLNLIALFDYYLILTFILSTVMRYRQYRAITGLLLSAPARWPKLLQLLSAHRQVFLSWPTLLPVALTFGLMVIHMLAYYLVWPAARVTPVDLWQHWLISILLALLAIGMLILDYDACFNIWEVNRAEIEPYLDQAEYWLGSWVAPALTYLTLGYVNPRQLVHDEVRKALTTASVDMKKMMWRWSLQIAVRLAFGLLLWSMWHFAVEGAA
jgi:hypothetical protein